MKKKDSSRKTLGLLVGGAVLIVLGLLIHLDFPINKKLGTSSFTFLTCGISTILLAIFMSYLSFSNENKIIFSLDTQISEVIELLGEPREMKIEEIDKLVILTVENLLFSEVFSTLKQELTDGKGKGKNVILDLSNLTELQLSDLLTFQELSDLHTNAKYSFVIVNDAINHNDLPETLHVTPTLQEAKDIVAMEEIERDLGF